MANYNDAQQLLQQLKPIINQYIEKHPAVKSAIKAQKAVVWASPNTNEQTVKVKFLPDVFNQEVEPLTFPYNPQMESFLVDAIPKQTVISIWYYQNINNGIVMQDGEWIVAQEGGGSGNSPIASNETPLMDGIGAAGTAQHYARGDHRHPTDTSRASAIGLANEISRATAEEAKKADLSGAIFTGNISAPQITGNSGVYDGNERVYSANNPPPNSGGDDIIKTDYLRVLEFTSSNFSGNSTAGYSLTFSPSQTGYTTADFLVLLERNGTETSQTGFYTQSDTVFVGSNGSILLTVNEPFAGRLLLLSGAIWAGQVVISASYSLVTHKLTLNYANGQTSEPIQFETKLSQFNNDTNFTTLQATRQDKYDVGDIVVRTNNVSPAAKYGGTWTQIKDVFLLAAGNTYAAGSTGGSATHINQIGTPNNTNALALLQANIYSNGTGIGFLPKDYTAGWQPREAILGGSYNNTADYGLRSGATQVVGETKTASNMPPYLTVYVWQKIA